jgi:hypothetical protein
MTMGIRVEPGGRVTFLEDGERDAAPSTAGAPKSERSRSSSDSSDSSEESDSSDSSEERGAGAAAVAALALSAIACPVWVAVRSPLIRKVALGLAAALALIAAFQAAAMGRGSPLLLLCAPLLLLADAFVARYRAPRRA